ncbi:TIGR04076 family protein [Spirochaetia bacterium]|nr:TIGR04076 family protein [Spirochaetia bacterium]
MKKIKITVLSKMFYADLAECYLTEGRDVGPCPILNEGEEYIYNGQAIMPDGFCQWAWIDIYRSISALSAGGTFTPWNKQDNMQILCCIDGVRPVIFKIEALDEECD